MGPARTTVEHELVHAAVIYGWARVLYSFAEEPSSCYSRREETDCQYPGYLIITLRYLLQCLKDWIRWPLRAS
jgi:hypothetical protein